jgi:putative MATE family efflux protein
MNKDLTVGKPSQVLWQFCLPMFGSIIFQQLYNIADSLVAGKFIGENALAAVGNSYEITLIFIAFAFGCNIGCSVIVSRYFGAKEYDDMKTSVYTALIGSAVLCAALMVFGLLGCRSLLELINTPEEILADSALYLDIYVLGLPFMFFYNIATGIFSALGDSKTPFYFLAVSSLSNIGVDILFVAGFHMGVAGVAWATFLCQGVSCILAMVVVFRRMKAIPAQRKTVWFSWNMLGKIAVVAIPSILQQSFISVGNIILQSVILWRQRHCRLLCRRQAEQHGHHLLHHPGQRHFQLHLPEHGCRQDGPRQGGLWCGPQSGVAHLCAHRHPVLLLRPHAAAAVHE